MQREEVLHPKEATELFLASLEKSWLGVDVRQIHLLGFIGRLNNLQHLSLYNFSDEKAFDESWQKEEAGTGPLLALEDRECLHAIVAGPQSLKLSAVEGPLLHYVSSGASDLLSLDIDCFPPTSSPLRQLQYLQHLGVETERGGWRLPEDVVTMISSSSETLESLNVEYCGNIHDKYLPSDVLFPKLSSFQITLSLYPPSYEYTVNQKILPSFWAQTPNLQHLRFFSSGAFHDGRRNSHIPNPPSSADTHLFCDASCRCRPLSSCEIAHRIDQATTAST